MSIAIKFNPFSILIFVLKKVEQEKIIKNPALCINEG